MEIQILDDPAEVYKNIIPAQHTGSIYYQAEAKQGAAKPAGEWNHYEITCLGPHVKVVLNGQVVTDAMIDQYKQGKGGHKALSERPQVGYVGLQSHESGGKFEPIDFRDIEIKDLTTALPSGLHYVDLVEGKGAVVPQEPQLRLITRAGLPTERSLTAAAIAESRSRFHCQRSFRAGEREFRG